jgi:hypothetical protein
MAISVTVRRAALTDRAAMRALATTKVGGTSPLDDKVAEYPGVVVADFSLAELQARVQSGLYQVPVAYAGATLRGWGLYIHHDGVRGVVSNWQQLAPRPTDEWEFAYIIVDKSLVMADRLSVVQQISEAAANQVTPSTYIWTDIRVGTTLDGFLAPKRPSVPVVSRGLSCNRYYAPAIGNLNVRWP